MKTGLTAGESRAQVIFSDKSCSETWVHESRVHKKNPIRERSGCGGEMVIWVRLRLIWPEWVKLNSSSWMMDRVSDLSSVWWISAEVRVKRRVMVMMMTWKEAICGLDMNGGVCR